MPQIQRSLGIQLPELATIALADRDGGAELLPVQDGLSW